MLASSALLGLTDMDALTFSLTELAGRSAPDGGPAGVTAAAAARGLLIGMFSNTVFKAAVATALGASAFRLRVVAALALLGALFAVGLFWI